MKLTFFGTSHGVPAPDRFCTATLLECGGRAYLIDAGAPVADLLIRYGIPFEKLRAVFLTHMHLDHTSGLTQLCSLGNWYFTNSSWDIFLPEDEGIEAFRRLLLAGDKSLDETRIRFCRTAPGRIFSDEHIRVTAIPTLHMAAGFPSFAYQVEGEGKRLIFTGDLHGPDASDFPAAAELEPSDAVICEMAHFGPEAVFPHVKKCPTRHFFFHHVWHDYESSMAAIRALDGTLPFPVTAVSDGDSFEL